MDKPSASATSPAGDGSTLDDSQPTRVRWWVLGVVAFASASAYLTRYCISAANTTIGGELGFDDGDMGKLMSAFAFGYLLFQIPGGWLGSRFGTRFGFAFISIFWSLCNAWTAAVSMFGLMVASRFFLGVFQAGLTPISAKILKDWIPQSVRGKNSAAIGACMSIGGAFTIAFTGWLIDAKRPWSLDWRWIFAAYSLVGIVWAIGFYWFFRTYPGDHRSVNQAELDLINSADSNVAAASPPKGGAASRRSQEERLSAEELVAKTHSYDAAPESDDFASTDELDTTLSGSELALSMLSSRSLWGLCIQSFFRAAGYAFFVTWFFAFLEYSYEIDKTAAGKYTSWPLLSVVVGTLSGGVIVDWLLRRTGSKWISRSGTAFVALTICGILTMASAWAATAFQLSVVMAIGAMFSGLGSPAAWAATIDLGGRRTALFMGTMNMAGCLAGVVLPLVLGEWFEQIKQSDGDWAPVIYLHAAFYFAGAISWLFINPSDTPSERKPKPGSEKV